MTESTSPAFSRRALLGGAVGAYSVAAAATAAGQPAAGDAGAGPTVRPISREVSDAEMTNIFKAVTNWGRWGPGDQRGTLNHLGAAEVAAAARAIQLGRSLGLARPFPTRPAVGLRYPATHLMVAAGDIGCAEGAECVDISSDYIATNVHGMVATHMDALCHVFRDGRMYNGYPAAEVKSSGAPRNNILTSCDGVSGRGVLLDIPRARGSAFVEAHDLIGVADLEAAERRQRVRIGKGDLLLIRTGRDVRARQTPNEGDLYLAGLDPATAPWFHAREIAVLGGDGVSDAFPFGRINRAWQNPIHICAIAGMGMQLLDNLALETLADACAQQDRWSFLLILAPLRIEGGTGSPINPIAVL